MFDFEYNKEFYRLTTEHIKYTDVADNTNFINIFNELVKRLEAETPKYNKEYSEFIVSCVYQYNFNEDVLEAYRYDTILPNSIDKELSIINKPLEVFIEMLDPKNYLDYYEAVEAYEINIIKFTPKDNNPEGYTDIYLELLLYRYE